MDYLSLSIFSRAGIITRHHHRQHHQNHHHPNITVHHVNQQVYSYLEQDSP